MRKRPLRRSEGLLSHLFETSPDPITLTELDSGRYTLVNKAFEDFSGYTASEIVGRTAPTSASGTTPLSVTP